MLPRRTRRRGGESTDPLEPSGDAVAQPTVAEDRWRWAGCFIVKLTGLLSWSRRSRFRGGWMRHLAGRLLRVAPRRRTTASHSVLHHWSLLRTVLRHRDGAVAADLR